MNNPELESLVNHLDEIIEYATKHYGNALKRIATLEARVKVLERELFEIKVAAESPCD